MNVASRMVQKEALHHAQIGCNSRGGLYKNATRLWLTTAFVVRADRPSSRAPPCVAAAVRAGGAQHCRQATRTCTLTRVRIPAGPGVA